MKNRTFKYISTSLLALIPIVSWGQSGDNVANQYFYDQLFANGLLFLVVLCNPRCNRRNVSPLKHHGESSANQDL